MRDKIISFFREKGIALCEKSETILETEDGYSHDTIKGLCLKLISAGFAVAGDDKISKLPKLFLLTPLSGDMCKYKLEIDFGAPMKIPFCPDCRLWRTQEDEAITLSEYLESSGWDGDYLQIVGSKDGDYAGASNLFSVTMHRAMAEKLFGEVRILSAELHNAGEINVLDRDHFFDWAQKSGIEKLSDLRGKYSEYQRLFPQNCSTGLTRVRVSV